MTNDFSCHTSAFADLPLIEALGTIARLGFRAVDLSSGTHLDLARAAAEPNKTAAELRRDLDLFTLRLADLALLLPRISLADADRRRAEIDQITALLPFAQALNAPGVSLSPGLSHPAEDAEAFSRTRDALREVVDAAQKLDLRVSIVPHVDSMAAQPEAITRLLDAVSGLELTLDWAALIYQDAAFEAITALLPRVRHVTLRQAARAQLQTPGDRGRIEIPRVVAALRAAGYDGAVGVHYLNVTEPAPPHGLIGVDVIRETAALRDALKAARDRTDV